MLRLRLPKPISWVDYDKVDYTESSTEYLLIFFSNNNNHRILCSLNRRCPKFIYLFNFYHNQTNAYQYNIYINKIYFITYLHNCIKSNTITFEDISIDSKSCAGYIIFNELLNENVVQTSLKQLKYVCYYSASNYTNTKF